MELRAFDRLMGGFRSGASKACALPRGSTHTRPGDFGGKFGAALLAALLANGAAAMEDPLYCSEGGIITGGMLEQAANLAKGGYATGQGEVGLAPPPGGQSPCNKGGPPGGSPWTGNPKVGLGEKPKKKGTMAEYQLDIDGQGYVYIYEQWVLKTHRDVLEYEDTSTGAAKLNTDALVGVLAAIIAHEYIHHCLGDLPMSQGADSAYSCKHLAIDSSVAKNICAATTQLCALIQGGQLGAGEKQELCDFVKGLHLELERIRKKWNSPAGKQRAQECKDCQASINNCMGASGAVDQFHDCPECGVALPPVPGSGSDEVIPGCTPCPCAF
jgi:hypothetical protein